MTGAAAQRRVDPATRRVCIAGAGFARRYAQAFLRDPGTEVVGVCARTAESAAKLVATAGGNPYTDFDAMLSNEGADIVVVATPNYLHHPMAMAALQNGAEVICEKPLGLDAGQAAELTSYAASLGRQTGTSFTWRFLPACVALKSLLDSGTLGELYHVELRYFTRGFGTVHGPMRWQFDRSEAGSGALANLGSHALDLIHWWFGDVVRVASIARTVIPTRATVAGDDAAVSVDDVCSATYELAGGVPLSLTVGWVAHVERVGLDVAVHGSAGSAWLRFATGERTLGQLAVCDETMARPSTITLDEPNAAEWADMGQACVSRLVAEFLDTRQGPDFVDGLRAQCVLDATLAASQNRCWIDIVYPAAAVR